jgi:hypothetical protein
LSFAVVRPTLLSGTPLAVAVPNSQLSQWVPGVAVFATGPGTFATNHQI